MTLLRDVLDGDRDIDEVWAVAKRLLGSYCFDRPCTIRLMSSNAPVHDGKESIHDIHVVDQWYIDQDDLDAVLYDSQHDTGGYLDQYGFRALQNQRENDK